MTLASTGTALPGNLTRQDIEDFLYREARLQDEHRYAEWEELWSRDAHYWVPAGGDDIDPDRQVSFVNDNRRRIATRVRQLGSGDRHAQSPPSRLRRIVGNIEVVGPGEGDEVFVEANFLLAEVRSGRSRLWAGRTRYGLRCTQDGMRMFLKKVMLIDNADPLPTMAFLI